MPKPEKNRLNLAEAARTLVAVNSKGMLATLDREDGYPYGSVADYLPLADGDIVLLLSRLAEHQQNLAADQKASLLIAPALGDSDMMSQARVSLLGEISLENTKETYADGFLALHPGAEAYLHFDDFAFYRLNVKKVRYIAGFGHMGWLAGIAYHAASADPLGLAAESIIKHMNDDHEHNLIDYARAFAGFDWVESCAMTSIDRYGFELFCRGQGQAEMTRLVFDSPVTDPQQVRKIMVLLAQRAREVLDRPKSPD